MTKKQREILASIRRFDQLIAYLRDELDWPIGSNDFEDLTFDYTPEELGIDEKNSAKIQEIKRLRPLSPNQPWGIFFVKFEPKRLPVVALRRILSSVVLKKRASANSAERQAWAADDLLFVSNYGEGDQRQITFANFSEPQAKKQLPTLKVLGWDNRDTPLHLDGVADKFSQYLFWPENDEDTEAWREQWQGAFSLRHREVITTSKDLSNRLAELARAIRDRISTVLSIETEKGPLTKLMKAFQESLIHDLDIDGFADMYAQTIAYGLLSARIANPDKKTTDDFAAHFRTNPFLRELMETFINAGGSREKTGGTGIDFDELGISEVVELLDDANMEAVIRDFGDMNPQEDPVIHFYEHFLAAYDKKQKVKRGVFYTPRPVVSYIVRSVDKLLRIEFDLEDGLADSTTWGEMVKKHKDLEIPKGVSPEQAFVQILDPATGTGTFLVEVIDLIYKTLVEKWNIGGNDDKQINLLWNKYVPEKLLPRLHGYELLMAPYAIAHLKIGLKLYETGYRFGSDERARVYLTNSLEPPSDEQIRMDIIPALAHEARDVSDVKQKQHFTVIIGNPPYSGESANKIPWIHDLVNSKYQYINGKKIIEKGKKNWLLDDYVKFIRLSHYIAEREPAIILGLITNHSYLDNPTFRGMRHSLMVDFTDLYLIDLHGNQKKGETCPDGSKDENVFEIQQGVSIGIFIKSLLPKSSQDNGCRVLISDIWGSRDNKYKFLMNNTCSSSKCKDLQVDKKYYFFKDIGEMKPEYEGWWPINEIFTTNGIGIITAHDHFSIAFDDQELTERLNIYLDQKLTDSQVLEALQLKENSMWNIHDARKSLRSSRNEDLFVDVLYRPFDNRRTFYHKSVVFNQRLPVMKHMIEGENIALISSRMTKGENFAHVFASRTITENILLSAKTSNNAFCFPLYLRVGEFDQGNLFDNLDGFKSNIDPLFIRSISTILSGYGSSDENIALNDVDVFYYIYGILHSPTYRSRYENVLKRDFPRIPFPKYPKLLDNLASLGIELVKAHLLESPILKNYITKIVGTGEFNVEKVSYCNNTIWIDKKQTRGFEGVPGEIWDFKIGGYQVCKKWLDYRKSKGGKIPRPAKVLTEEDFDKYQKIIVSLNETIRIMREIDEVIKEHGGWPDAFEVGE